MTETSSNKNSKIAVDMTSSIFKFSINTWVNFFINFFVLIGTTYLFLPEELGKINMFITSGLFLSSLVPLGMDQAYLRFYSDPPNNRFKKHLIVDGFLISGCMIVFLTIVVFIFKYDISYWMVGGYECDVLVLLFVYVVSYVVLYFLNLTYRLQGLARLYTIQAILITISSKLLHSLAGFIWPNHRVSIYIISLSILILSVFFLKLQCQSIDFREYKIDKIVIKKMLQFGLPILLWNMLITLEPVIIRMIIKKFYDFSSIGIYSVGLQISNLLGLVSNGFSCFWIPFVYSNYKDDSKSYVIKNMLKYISLVAVLLVCFIVLFQDVICLFIGSEYQQIKELLSFMLVSPALCLISWTTMMGITIFNKTYWMSIICCISIAVNVLMSLLLIKPLGLLGVAIASSIEGIVILILRTIIGNRHYKINYSMKNIFISILMIILLCSLNYLFRESIMSKYIIIVILILIETLIYKKEVCYLIKILCNASKEIREKLLNYFMK